MGHPAVALAPVFQHIGQLFVQLGNGLFQQVNIRIVLALIRKKFLFRQNAADKVLIELCLEALNLCHAFFIGGDLPSIFLGQLPVDPFLADT